MIHALFGFYYVLFFVPAGDLMNFIHGLKKSKILGGTALVMVDVCRMERGDIYIIYI